MLAGLAQVAGIPQHCLHAVAGLAGRLGHCSGGQLLGQAELDAGELGRDLRLAQVANGREEPGRGLVQQCREALDELQAATRALQVPVRLGDSHVLHGVPLQAADDRGGPSLPEAYALPVRPRSLGGRTTGRYATRLGGVVCGTVPALFLASDDSNWITGIVVDIADSAVLV